MNPSVFSVAQVSDLQVSGSTGMYFESVFSQVVGKNDFILHIGDVVETSKYERKWTDMQHTILNIFPRFLWWRFWESTKRSIKIL